MQKYTEKEQTAAYTETNHDGIVASLFFHVFDMNM